MLKAERAATQHTQFDSKCCSVWGGRFLYANLVFLYANLVFLYANLVFLYANFVFLYANLVFLYANLVFLYANLVFYTPILFDVGKCFQYFEQAFDPPLPLLEKLNRNFYVWSCSHPKIRRLKMRLFRILKKLVAPGH